MNLEVNPASAASERVYAAPVHRPEHEENLVTDMLEQQTAKIPSTYFLFAALSAMGLSAILTLTGRHRAGEFIARWPGPLLTMGVYNKLVKTRH